VPRAGACGVGRHETAPALRLEELGRRARSVLERRAVVELQRNGGRGPAERAVDLEKNAKGYAHAAAYPATGRTHAQVAGDKHLAVLADLDHRDFCWLSAELRAQKVILLDGRRE
jgi:hypothetical protein